MGRGEIKRAGAGEKGKKNAGELSFPHFLAIFPLKEPLRRGEISYVVNDGVGRDSSCTLVM